MAARAIGVNVWRARIASFVVSAMLVALGGVLQGHFLGTVNVTQFYIGITFITIAMLVIGGTGSLAGAVIGTVAVSVIAELLRHLEKGVEIGAVTLAAPAGLRELGLAGAMMLILIFRPAGLTGGRELPFPRLSRRRAYPTIPLTRTSHQGHGLRRAQAFDPPGAGRIA